MLRYQYGGSQIRLDHPYTLFNMRIDALTLDESVEACADLIEARVPAHHVVVNAGKIVLADSNPKLQAIIGGAALVNADGQSIVTVGRLAGIPLPERVTGIDLMHVLLREASDRGWPVFFLGAKKNVLDMAVRHIQQTNPDLVIAGTHHGYFEDDLSVVKQIKSSGARLLFIAMPSPKKELWVDQYASELGPCLSFGVGGSLDVVAGVTLRAPLWMQRSGLEWAFRLIQEPRRMWRRYLIGNLKFLRLAIPEVYRKRRQNR